MAQRPVERSLRGGPLPREVAQQETFRRGPEINPAARGDGASLVVAPVAQENNDLMDLAKGLSGLSKGLDTYFQLQATYGRINMEEAKIRGALGLPKGHGLGLEWGVDKGFNEGQGISIGTKISTEISQRLQEEDYGISQGVTPENYPQYMEKVTQDITSKYLGSNPNGDVLNGAADNIAKAKVAGEIDGYRRHWVERQSQQAQIVTGATDDLVTSQVQTIHSMFDKNAAVNPGFLRDNLSKDIKVLAEKFKLPREQVNQLYIMSISTAIENNLTNAGKVNGDPREIMKAMTTASSLLEILKAKDNAGFSFSKSTMVDTEGRIIKPYATSVKAVQDNMDKTVSTINKGIQEAIEQKDKQVYFDVNAGIMNNKITPQQAREFFMTSPSIKDENRMKYLTDLDNNIEAGNFIIEDSRERDDAFIAAREGKLSTDMLRSYNGRLNPNTIKELINISVSKREHEQLRSDANVERAQRSRDAKAIAKQEADDKKAEKANEARLKAIGETFDSIMLPTTTPTERSMKGKSPEFTYTRQKLLEYADANKDMTPEDILTVLSKPFKDPSGRPVQKLNEMYTMEKNGYINKRAYNMWLSNTLTEE